MVQQTLPRSPDRSHEVSAQGAAVGQSHRGLLGNRQEEGPPVPGLRGGVPPESGAMGEKGTDKLASQSLMLPGVADPDVQYPPCAARLARAEAKPTDEVVVAIEQDDLGWCSRGGSGKAVQPHGRTHPAHLSRSLRRLIFGTTMWTTLWITRVQLVKGWCVGGPRPGVARRFNDVHRSGPPPFSLPARWTGGRYGR